MSVMEGYSNYRISANSFRRNYSFLNLILCTVTFGLSTYRCGNYSREETIQGKKLFKARNYSRAETIRRNAVSRMQMKQPCVTPYLIIIWITLQAGWVQLTERSAFCELFRSSLINLSGYVIYSSQNIPTIFQNLVLTPLMLMS